MRLFFLALLTLYLELAAIRFASAEVLYLGYFSNYVLISVFFGIGIGFLVSDRKIDLFALLPQLLLFFVAFVAVTKLDVTLLRTKDSQLYWGLNQSSFALPLWLCLPLLFGVVSLIFAAIAQQTARAFRAYKPLTAYSIDIGGSLAGITAFTFHSYIGASPVQWFIVAFVLIVGLSRPRVNAVLVGVGVVILLIAVQPQHYTRWSPYQKIEVRPDASDGWMLHANGIGHQTMHRPGQKEVIYDFPYTEVAQKVGRSTYDRVLVIGAGTGTDTAYALHYGVGHVDAVEIDPEIRRAGRRFHPSHPYDSPKVTVRTGDGRAYMERATPGSYDLVIYALPDSIALISNYSSIRLESFLFTVESFAQAKRLLKPDGVLVLYNYYRKTWLLEKLASMLTHVFGHPPLVQSYGTEAENLMSTLAIGPTLQGPPRSASYEPATDDWPFLYMKEPTLPSLYGWIMLMFVGSSIITLLVTRAGTRQTLRRNGPFLLMGAAFLLLEVKSVIQFSLLFGATWLVNSLVFFAILVSVLVANFVVSRIEIKRPIVPFGLLLASLLLNVVLPAHDLLAIESMPLRYVLASLVFFSPIFFANVVFGFLFKDTEDAEKAFGWNITGAMIGAALEYTSLVLGYQKLMLVALGLYVAAAAWAYALRRGVTGKPAAARPT